MVLWIAFVGTLVGPRVVFIRRYCGFTVLPEGAGVHGHRMSMLCIAQYLPPVNSRTMTFL